jgi:signal transduction histidine kinase
MSLNTRTARFAYAIHLVLSLLVIGVLAWATNSSLRLEQRERQVALDHERESKVRAAMYHMENLANPILFREFQREYTDYSPLFSPNPDQVRFRTGEMLPPGSLIAPSPLLLRPPQQNWLKLHFQLSPDGGFSSPQVPERQRIWPLFAMLYDLWPREICATTLSSLERVYSPDELLRRYDEARTPGENVELADNSPEPPPSTTRRYARSKYAVQRWLTITELWKHTVGECTPQRIAVLNLRTVAEPVDAPLSNDAAADDELVDIQADPMRPVWLKLPYRSEPDLVFLREVKGLHDRVLQGFVVDWPRFREDLLEKVRYLFPHATLEPLRDDATGPADDVFGYIPARFLPNDPPVAVAGFAWDSTHTFLAVSWLVCLSLLAGLAVGARQLVGLFERRSQFAYAVTHELRTPLTTFRLYTDMLAQGLVPAEKQPEYLETLNQESRRLADLVSSVLEYSRVENNSVPINREPVKVASILESVRDAFGPRCANAGVELKLDDRGIADSEVQTDRQHLVQIIGNLVDNACKYGRGGAKPEVCVSAERVNGSYHFDVTDNGPGIPARLRHTIFKPYRRGDTESTPATGGIGLGLSLSRSWARLLGGNLELVPSSGAEQGARFRVRLPADAN